MFVSSTYTDLVAERRRVMEVLLKADCLPAGMELFPASNQDQLQWIKRIIDDSDYYVLIVGGRYGSVTEEGFSYTEQEYDYAVEIGKPVLSFLHSAPGSIPLDRSELDPAARERLQAFRTKVGAHRLVSFFNTPDELAINVTHAINRAVRDSPAKGWVRGAELTRLTAELNELKHQLQSAATPDVMRSANISGGEDEFIVEVDLHYVNEENMRKSFDEESAETTDATVRIPTTWNQLFFALGDTLLDESNYIETTNRISGFALELIRLNRSLQPDDCVKLRGAWTGGDVYRQVVVQLLAQGLISRVEPRPHSNKEWRFTDAGLATYVDQAALRRRNC